MKRNVMKVRKSFSKQGYYSKKCFILRVVQISVIIFFVKKIVCCRQIPPQKSSRNPYNLNRVLFIDYLLYRLGGDGNGRSISDAYGETSKKEISF